MAARDVFHQAVKQALIKDGWTITADPLVVQFGSIDLYIDLGAEKLIAAEKPVRRLRWRLRVFSAPRRFDNG